MIVQRERAVFAIRISLHIKRWVGRVDGTREVQIVDRFWLDFRPSKARTSSHEALIYSESYVVRDRDIGVISSGCQANF